MIVFPKLVLSGLMDCHRRWLNSFAKNHIPMICSLVSVPFHYLWCYVFVVYLDLELIGIGIAGAISLGLQNLFLIAYTKSSHDLQYKASIFSSQVCNLEEFKLFVKVALPSVFMFWINWWIWEVIVLITGTISVEDQATHIITMNIYSLFMNWSFGFNQSTCTLVGKRIGQKDVSGAKRVSRISYILTLISFMIASVTIYLNLMFFSSILSELPEILEKVSYDNRLFGKFSLTFLIALTFIPDAMKYSQIGVLKALGIQDKGLLTSFVGNWFFNLSFMYLFIFCLDFGLHGIWVSKSISDTFIFISNVILVKT